MSEISQNYTMFGERTPSMRCLSDTIVLFVVVISKTWITSKQNKTKTNKQTNKNNIKKKSRKNEQLERSI